jgi:hypothetical protein
MKEYLKSVFPRIERLSRALNETAILIDQPWVSVLSPSAPEKLIFKADGELLVARKGIVERGRWEYLPGAKALMIDTSTGSRLYAHGYLDPALMVLRIDGEDSFYVLANQNLIPDLDIERYLRNLELASERGTIARHKDAGTAARNSYRRSERGHHKEGGEAIPSVAMVDVHTTLGVLFIILLLIIALALSNSIFP